LVVQNQQSLGSTSYINVCPLTSVVKSAEMIRILLNPTEQNGLKHASMVEIDLIDSVLASSIDGVIGCVDANSMRKIDTALRRWLDL
jgi:mRNA interferase MazF